MLKLANSITNTIIIGKNIKHYRNLNKLTQKELGIKIHKSEISIRKYESGKGNIPMSAFFDLAQNLNINIMDLLQNKDGGIDDTEVSIYEALKEFDIGSIGDNKSDYFEQYIKSLGYEINGDKSEGYLVINTPDNETYEISEKDIEELETTTKSFVQFKLQDIIKNLRKIGK